MTVVGIENVDYVSKKTGNRVFGKKLHTSEELSADKGMGVSTEVVFCSGDMADDIILGDTIRVYYNKYGSVESVLPA